MNKGRWILLALALVLTASILSPGYAAAPSPQENVSLYAGNRLIISSTQQAIRSVVVRGNLSATIVSNVTYPAKNFTLTTNSTQLYTLNIWLSYPSTYTTAITINDPVSRSNSLYTSYYVSAGDMNLTIFADFRLVQPVRQRIPPLDQDTIHNTRSTVRIRRLPMDQVRG